MITQVWTSQFRYPGPYRMDITYATTDPIGKYFAPTKAIVHKYKYATADADVAQAVYKEEYAALLSSRGVDKPEHPIWNQVAAMPYIVLVCYCGAQLFCHRHIVKDLFHLMIGSTYVGEFTDFGYYKKSVPKNIDSFSGEYTFLSNFYHSLMKIHNILWKTNEHFFQAMKGHNSPVIQVGFRPDAVARELNISIEEANTLTYHNYISRLATPGKAKRAGRIVTRKANWEGDKQKVMMVGVNEKFIQNPHLGKMLTDLGREAIFTEGNTWHDNYWGNCTCERCGHIEGENHLGIIIALQQDMMIGGD
jgi:predicted NAD-dependent protein-ADP-ribosyltransferase YbiA (DUF1768 family)